MPFIWRKETIRIVLPRCNSATCPNVNVIIFILSILVLQTSLGFDGLWIGLIIFMSARAITLAFAYPKIEANELADL